MMMGTAMAPAPKSMKGLRKLIAKPPFLLLLLI
jgi:hypothetical protein